MQIINSMLNFHATFTKGTIEFLCGDCGGIYGSKIFHSNDRYRKVVLVCNDKYKKKGDFCKTPNLTEENVKSRFIKAYNDFMGDRTKLIEKNVKKWYNK